jgi:cell division protein FtsB
MKKIIPYITNKYLLTTLFFVVWMLFFDQRDFFYVREQKQKLKTLQNTKRYYQTEIAKAQQELTDLQSNPAALEKFAREHYKMKKDGEDIYLVEDTVAVKK